MMNCILLRLITTLICVLSVAAYLPYEILRLNDEGNSTAYLIINGVAKAIPDDQTIITLGFNPESLLSISQIELRKLKVGPAVVSLKYNNQTPDELTRIEVLKSIAFQGELVYNVLDIGNYINPSVVKWRGRLLSASCLSVGQSGSKNKPSNGNVEFRWVNHTDYPFRTTEAYLGIENEIESLNVVITGQDPRIVVLSEDKLQVYFTNQLGEHFIRMGMAVLEMNHTTNKLEVTNFYRSIYPMSDPKQHHKNWSPFIFRDEVLLIQSIQPLIVLKTSAQDVDKMAAFHESTSEMAEFYWPYGELRGGTNAVFLKEQGVYLAFLHSAGHVPGSGMKTYVMGAYTFSAEPPFRVLSMSPYPILPYRFYDGPWHPIKNRQIDYCVFPMSIIVEDKEVLLSFGHQDQRGYLVRINLHTLLDTLVLVKTKEKSHGAPR